MAVLEWDNNMEFEGLETVLNVYDGAKAKSYAMEAPSKTEQLQYSTTQKKIRFSEHGWDTTEVSLQTSVQGSVGEASKRLRLFSIQLKQFLEL